MKTRVQISLVGCLIILAVQAYQTLHWYPLKFGFASGPSACSISQKLDCDAVSLSDYSSILNVPVSIWGGALAAVMFYFILLGWLEWSERPERIRRTAMTLAGLNAIASLVMAAISATLLNVYCPFCILIYLLSFIIFFAYRGVLREPYWAGPKSDLPDLATSARGYVLGLAAIPIMSFLVHKMFMSNFSDSEVQRVVNEAIMDWERAPKQDFVAKPSLAMGPPRENARMTLVEFADFRCSHCKHASHTLDPFLKVNKDVRLEFYAFPLDGACNEKIPQADGISCRLAEAVYCAEKDGKGWDMHHALFQAQSDVNRLGTASEIDQILSKEVANLGLNWETVERCITDPATVDAIKAQAKQGALVNVQGTPTIFANGRQLPRAQFSHVLSAARARSDQR